MVRLTEGISGLLESILRLVIAAGSTLPAIAQDDEPPEKAVSYQESV